MRRFVACSIVIAMISVPMTSVAAVHHVELVLAGTEVLVRSLEPLSSSTANVGDLFAFTAAEDVVIDGRVTVRAGALGQGEVVSVAHAGSSGRSGSLGLKYDWVFSVDGGKIKLAGTPQVKSEGDRHGASLTMSIVGIASFGLAGFFGHNFVHGRDVVIAPTKTLHAFVASNVHVATVDVDDIEKGFDR